MSNDASWFWEIEQSRTTFNWNNDVLNYYLGVARSLPEVWAGNSCSFSVITRCKNVANIVYSEGAGIELPQKIVFISFITQEKKGNVMKRYKSIAVCLLFLTGCLFISSSFADTTPGVIAAPDVSSAYWITIAMVTIFLILTLALIRNALKASDWKLADALSEEADLPDGSKAPDPKNPSKPLMVASSSRLIAFLGSLMLITMFIGFGYYIIWAYYSNRTIPDFKNLTDFLWAGAGMFLPYAVNQARTAISSIAK